MIYNRKGALGLVLLGIIVIAIVGSVSYVVIDDVLEDGKGSQELSVYPLSDYIGGSSISDFISNIPVIRRISSISGGGSGSSSSSSDDGDSGDSGDGDSGSTNTPPVANAGLDQTVNEGDLVTLDGSLSSDADLDTLTYSWMQVGGPSVTLSDYTAVTPTFTAPFVAGPSTLTFSLVVNDGTDNSNTDNVEITINDVPNNPPMAHDHSFSIDEDTNHTFYLSGTDFDGDNLTFFIETDPSEGVVNLNETTGEVTYSPNLDYNGADSFTFVAYDGIVNSTSGTIYIQIYAVNDAPVVNIPSDVVFDEDSYALVDFSSYVDDVDNLDSEITWSFSGNVEIQAVPNEMDITFYANNDWFGSEVVTARATDLDGDYSEFDFNINVTAVDDPATWNVLLDQGPLTDPIPGTVVYANLGGQCFDIDSPVVVIVNSTHPHYTLSMSGNNLVMNSFDGIPTKETVTVECNGVQETFDLTTCHYIPYTGDLICGQ